MKHLLRNYSWLFGLFSTFVVADVTMIVANVEKYHEHKSSKTTVVGEIANDESELSQLYKAAAKLEEQKVKLPKDSPKYVDLDKNLSDIYARLHLAEKYLAKLKSNSNKNTKKIQSDFNFLMTDIREIINLNTQQSE